MEKMKEILSYKLPSNGWHSGPGQQLVEAEAGQPGGSKYGIWDDFKTTL